MVEHEKWEVKSCGDCGRPVFDANIAGLGWVAMCGRRIAELASCGHRICETVGNLKFGPEGERLSKRQPDR